MSVGHDEKNDPYYKDLDDVDDRTGDYLGQKIKGNHNNKTNISGNPVRNDEEVAR